MASATAVHRYTEMLPICATLPSCADLCSRRMLPTTANGQRTCFRNGIYDKLEIVRPVCQRPLTNTAGGWVSADATRVTPAPPALHWLARPCGPPPAVPLFGPQGKPCGKTRGMAASQKLVEAALRTELSRPTRPAPAGRFRAATSPAAAPAAAPLYLPYQPPSPPSAPPRQPPRHS